MKINPIQYSYINLYTQKNTSQPSFEKRGNPVALNYIVEKRSYLLPERVLEKAKEALAKSWQKMPTLMEIHKEIYAPLLDCKTLDEAKTLFSEFSEMTEDVVFERNSRYAREFHERAGDNFALKMLQEFWARLKTKDEIAKEMGMTSRSTLEWPLKQIGFVTYPSNYKTILKSSDPEGNKIIAGKTTAYNQLHPEWKDKLNKMGADAWKSSEVLKQEQSIRMHELDKIYPERVEKISEHSRIMWAEALEVRKALTEHITNNEPIEVKRAFAKKIKGIPLRASEHKMVYNAYARFWAANPEQKQNLSDASKRASQIRGIKK